MFDPNSPIGYPDGRGMQRPLRWEPGEGLSAFSSSL